MLFHTDPLIALQAKATPQNKGAHITSDDEFRVTQLTHSQLPLFLPDLLEMMLSLLELFGYVGAAAVVVCVVLFLRVGVLPN